MFQYYNYKCNYVVHPLSFVLHHAYETPPAKVLLTALTLMSCGCFSLGFPEHNSMQELNQVAVGPLAKSHCSNPTPVTNCRRWPSIKSSSSCLINTEFYQREPTFTVMYLVL